MSRLSIWTTPPTTTQSSPTFPLSTYPLRPIRMSTSTPPPPLTPTLPQTPRPSSPIVKVTLPTPPSFSARRNRAHSTTPMSPDQAIDNADQTITTTPKKTHGRSVSFSNNVQIGEISPESTSTNDSPESKDVYRIPQQRDDLPAISPALIRKAPPRLSLIAKGPSGTSGLKSPFSKNIPQTAPVGGPRFASKALAKGISIAPTLDRQSESKKIGSTTQLGGGGIWSARLNTDKAGWITPGLGSARSVGTSGRVRGLTVGVLRDGKGELLIGDVPVTPGLGSGKSLTPGLGSGKSLGGGFNGKMQGVKEEKEELPLEWDAMKTGDPITASGQRTGDPTKRKEIILCRYYHTPGLTCTSRPCRFVHNLEGIFQNLTSPNSTNQVPPTPRTIANYPMLSPNANIPDPTFGTFAHAQNQALSGSDSVDVSAVSPGEVVKLAGVDGQEVLGTVFLMSGGGKGPAGKSKGKYKTVLCKDYQEGTCPYGEYCSFIHETKKAASVETQATNSEPISIEDDQSKEEGSLQAPSTPSSRRNSTGTNPSTRPTHAKAASMGNINAWAKALPKAVLVPSVKLGQGVLDKHAKEAGSPQDKGLSAFAPPWSTEKVVVDSKGELVPARESVEQVVERKVEDSGQTTQDTVKPSAWSKGPPGAAKRVSIAPLALVRSNTPTPTSTDLETPTTATHLAVPISAVSLYATDSDPATPWDPAIRLHAPTPQTPSFPNINDQPQQPSVQYYQPEYSTYAYPTSESSSPPSYPWGMPMNPVIPPGWEVPHIQGGLGVMWTPAGWAVQDAAMKHALRGQEVKSKHVGSKRRSVKSYYKSRVCKFFAEGNCPHGNECTYLHELPSTNSTPHDSTKVKVTPHPNAQTLPCKFFNSSTGCLNGQTCAFLHTFVVPQTAPLVAHPRPWRTRPCRHYQVGRCTLGDACHFAHVFECGQGLVGLGKGGKGHLNGDGEESDSGDEDDLEIVTVGTSSTPMSVSA